MQHSATQYLLRLYYLIFILILIGTEQFYLSKHLIASKTKEKADLKSDELSLIASTTRPNRQLIIYSGPTHAHCTGKHRIYHKNFHFFLENGLSLQRNHSLHAYNDMSTDIIIVLGQKVVTYYRKVINIITNVHPNVIFMERPGDCYDMESFRLALEKSNLNQYSYFIFLNCGIIGPLLSQQFWSHHFIDILDEFTKLVGLSLNCDGKLGMKQAHIQSMIWATDRTGLNTILSSGNIYDCGTALNAKTKQSYRKERDELINRYELGISKAIMKRGYTIKAIHPIQKQLSFNDSNAFTNFPSECHDIWYRSKLDNANILFLKNTRFEPNLMKNIWAKFQPEGYNLKLNLPEPCSTLNEH
jgi:hypothetical protein